MGQMNELLRRVKIENVPCALIGNIPIRLFYTTPLQVDASDFVGGLRERVDTVGDNMMGVESPEHQNN